MLPVGFKFSEETKRKWSIQRKELWGNLEYREKIRKSKTKDLNIRFWNKINIKKPDECWEWVGAKDKSGYGLFQLKQKKLCKAHRLAFLLSGGALTPEKPCVLHHCDNPSCCNPAHLFAGSNADNSKDMVSKTRAAHNCGEKCGTSKLTEKDVLEIRKINGIISNKELANIYKVTSVSIRNIIIGKTWAHI